MTVRHLVHSDDSRAECGTEHLHEAQKARTLGEVSCGMCHRAYADRVNPRRMYLATHTRKEPA